MRRLIATTTMIALATAGTVATTTSADADPASKAGISAKKGHSWKATDFALKTSGFGTRVRGGQVPAGSDSTAYTVIACTNKAGIKRENHVANVELPGAGNIGAVTTTVWTQKKHGKVITHARSKTADIVLASSQIGSLSIAGVQSDSKVWHDENGFHAENTADIAKIIANLGGVKQEFPIPAPNQTVTVPGLAKISLGDPGKSVSKDGAKAHNDVLRITVLPTDTRVRIGHSVAEMHSGIKSGIFAGFGAGLKADALTGLVTTGRQPYQPMPCQGTDGKVISKNTVDLNLADQLVVDAVNAEGMTKQTKKHAGGYESASVAGLTLGPLHIDAIKAVVNVERKGRGLKKLVRNTKGTTLGAITVNGQRQEFPDTGVIEIPGLLRLTPNIVNKVKSGIAVTALRIELLDGTGATVNLGHAKLQVFKKAKH